MMHGPINMRLKVSVSSYFYQSARHHTQNSVIFEIQYFGTELKASCNGDTLVCISIKGHCPVNYNGRLSLIWIQTRTPIVILWFGWANRNSFAQLLFILSRTSGSNLGSCGTSQDSPLQLFVLLPSTWVQTLQFCLQYGQTSPKKFPEIHSTVTCHSSVIQLMYNNWTHSIEPVDVPTTMCAVPSCKKVHRVFVTNTRLLGAFAKLRKPTIRFLISNFRCVLNAVRFLLGNFPASEFYMPTFRNTLSVPSS